jgi:hypothetical protein
MSNLGIIGPDIFLGPRVIWTKSKNKSFIRKGKAVW